VIIGIFTTDPIRVSIHAQGGVMANGTSVQVTSTCEARITGGFGPFTYDWTDNNANVFVQASSSVTTRLQSTGTNTQHTPTIILKVTQANGVVTTASADLVLVHGTP
jgi:hypothetical protein